MKLLVSFAIYSLLSIAHNIEAGPTKSIGTSKTPSSLYAAYDGITVLTGDNFNQHVYNSSSASVVQFYNSPSEHCIRFAPVYKQLASSIQNWRDIVEVAAIDCSDSRNKQTCQQYEINDYPTIRYFAPQQKTFTTGKPISKENSEPAALRAEIIVQLVTSENKMPHFPDFSPLNSDNYESLQGMGNGRSLIVVVENEGSHVGHELMMDLHHVSNVMVRSTNNLKLSNQKEKLPQIYVLKSGYPPKRLALTNPTRHRTFKLVQSYLMNEGYNVPDYTEMQGSPNQNSEAYVNEMLTENLGHEDDAEAVLKAYMLIISALATPYQQNHQ